MHATTEAFFNLIAAGDPAPVGVLLRKTPALLEARNNSNASPLILAAQLGHTEVMKTLVAAGADIEATDNAGFTPLMHACLYAQRPAALYLVEQGAYAGRKTSMGMTAASLARAADFPSFADEIAGVALNQPDIEKAFWQREGNKAAQGIAKPLPVRKKPVSFKP